MSIEKIFDRERERYVEHFVNTRSNIAKEYPNTSGELLVSLNNETIPYPYRYLRIDVISRLDDDSSKIYEIKIDIDPDFQQRGFNFGSFSVEIYPFSWDSIQIVVNKPLQNTHQLEGWITRWLDVEDKHSEDSRQISHAIHSFSQIDNTGNWWYLTGDFGTAPKEALIEFIELMAGEGMTRIVLKSGDIQ